MYRNLLLIFLIAFSFSLFGQSITTDYLASNKQEKTVKITQLKVYPNPATHFIQIENTKGIAALVVYNLVGRKIKEFQVEKGKSYSITDLPKGMYLIQFIGLDSKILTTQRLSKR